jgi:hypothetical protein
MQSGIGRAVARYPRAVIALRLVVLALGVALGVFYPFIPVILASRGSAGADRARRVDRRDRLHARGARVGPHRRRASRTGADPAGVRDRRRRRGRGAARPWPPIVIALLFMAYWIFESSWQPLADALTVNLVDRRRYGRVGC